MRSEGERWLERDTDKRKQKKMSPYRSKLIFTQAQRIPPISDYRKMPRTSLVSYTVVMATQAGLTSRRVSG